ncbi:S41 family peptidase [Tissierella pigra]|uniref:Tail specific protease domain-containing protein n=1 Tax=Tissierella pigra TaxID=2607614 RepID=A0A6N7XLY4_9FIRM|nr:S41 family peptidase [Tissierella pigra]MSU02556.1 hypothetical protein [Tissierella pigra]
MKKLIRQVTVIAIILMLMLIFTACENSDEKLTTEDLLNDFDYMMQTMEDTFPYFGVVERKLGVDIRALGMETRTIIENYPYSLETTANKLGISLEDMPDLDEHIFWSIIYHEFFSHFMRFAHTFVLDFSRYNMYQPAFSNRFSFLYTPNNYNVFTNHVSQKFYQEQEDFYNTIFEDQEALFQFVFRDVLPVTVPSHNIVETEIIEEDRVAYLKISSFSNFDPSAVSTTLKTFYRDINEYEHLIIDIRDNYGGSTDFWRMIIMKPLLAYRENMPDMPLYAFFRGSKLGKSLAKDYLEIESQYSRYMPETDDLLSVNEIMESNNLPYISEDDLQDLDYGVKFNAGIGNIELQHLRQLGFPNISGQPFKGKVWLLTNENNYSASALFAHHAKEMGFATLVGEQVGGAYAINGAHFTLPNTGIILRWDIDYLTDNYGNALNEFPTTPHHFNNLGMDALETVLQLIEEGSF